MDERGVALPTALVILLVLGLIGSASVFMTMGDTNVAYLYGSSDRASAAAEGGLTHAVGVLQEELFGISKDDDLEEAIADLDWPLEGSVGEYDYSVTIARDSFDFDSDGSSEPASYHYGAHGYNGNDKGLPVYVLVSQAERGVHKAVETLRITKWILDFEVSAAVTLNTAKDIRIENNFLISGINTDLTGSEVDPSDTSYDGDCDENKAALHLTTPHELKGEGTPTPDLRIKENHGDLKGNPTLAANVPSYVTQEDDLDWQSVEDILGVEEGSLDFFQRTAAEHKASLPDSLSGVTWITDDIGSGGTCFSKVGCSSIQGRGILIVHNPLFNPREHDETDPMYDEAKAKDPDYAPATIDRIDGGTFRGVVIADMIPEHLNDGFTIYGTLFVLGHINDPPNKGFRFKITSAGAVGTIIYSCQGIEEASDIGVYRLSWMAD